MLLDLPSYCSGSGMLAEKFINDFYAIGHKRLASPLSNNPEVLIGFDYTYMYR